MDLRPGMQARPLNSLSVSDAARQSLRGFVDGARVGMSASTVRALFLSGGSADNLVAAEAVAHELGRGLLRVDLSAVISKFIGETEKNLDRVFRVAEESEAVLFFDEADALFGKRTEVKDSHDRFANIEVNYLLQKMGSFAGVTIVATNARVQIGSCRFCRFVELAAGVK